MKNYIAKRYMLLALSTLVSIGAYCQYYEETEAELTERLSHHEMIHELSAWGGAAYTPFRIDKDMGKKTGLVRPMVGVGYTFWFHNQIGIGSGVEYASYGSKIKLKGYTENISSPTQAFSAAVDRFDEKITADYLNIPLMAHFQTRGDGVRYYVSGGIKAGIPLRGRSEIKSVSADYRYSVPNDNTRFDIGHYDSPSGDESKIDFKSAFMLSAELGAKWRLSYNMFLYTGVYADYGLNNIRRTVYSSRTDLLLDYDPTRGENKLQTNSLLFSHHKNEQGGDDLFVDRIRPISVGLKVKFSFEVNTSRKTRNVPLRRYLRGKYHDESYTPSVDKHTRASNTEQPITTQGNDQASEAFSKRFGF